MKFKKLIAPIIITLVTIALFVTNYKAGTYLSGWDTLHPEFNPLLYLKRIWFSVWQFHQGLGAVASQAHAAELPRMLLYYPLMILLQKSLVRYAYFFITLVLGGLGINYFIQYMLSRYRTIHGNLIALTSFSGALFYLLNIGTLQFFYFPFEMFATYFAFLPWILLFASKYIVGNQRKDFLLFLGFIFFSSPIAHTPTLYYAFLLCLFVYVLSLGLSIGKAQLKRSILLIIMIVLMNSYWIFPNLYYLINYGKDVSNSKIHTMFLGKAFSVSQEFSDTYDILRLKNFYFEWGNFDNSKFTFVDIFSEWSAHFNSNLFIIIQNIFLISIIIGIYYMFRKKYIYFKPLIFMFFTTLFFIGNDIFIFRPFFELLQAIIPLFKEALRFPFTKFGIPLIFVEAVFFSLSITYIFELVHKYFTQIYRLRYVSFGMLSITIIFVYFMFPAFQGKFISSHMRVNIPEEYFDLFKYFDNKNENERIAYFPVHTYWGWLYYNWNYEGAGFLWFGLKQPILMREFDRWHPNNENFYWEISYAVYSDNVTLFESVLKKYQVNWLVIDKNVIDPSSSKSLYTDRLKELISRSLLIVQREKMNNLTVYEVSSPYSINEGRFIVSNPAFITPNTDWNNYDKAFLDNGTYILPMQGIDSKSVKIYPYKSLFTGRRQEDLVFNIYIQEDSYIIKPKFIQNNELLTTGKQYKIQIPEQLSELVEVNENDLSQTKTLQARFMLNDITYTDIKTILSEELDDLAVVIPKIHGLYSYEITTDSLFFFPVNSCGQAVEGSSVRYTAPDGLLRFSSIKANNCLVISLNQLPTYLSYLITVDSRNVSGNGFLFSVINNNSKKAEIETYLPDGKEKTSKYFIIPPMEKYGIGYTLIINNISIGDKETVNDLSKISVQPFPYNFLTNINIMSYTKDVLTSTNEQVLVYSQSYDKGWHAYQMQCQNSNVKCQIYKTFPFLFGEELKQHVLVNNWANGWILPKAKSSSQNPEFSNQLNNNDKLTTDNGRLITILYLPQYLEYLGFALMAAGLVFVVKYKHER